MSSYDDVAALPKWRASAFPLPATKDHIEQRGLTIRDYFAGQALAGMFTRELVQQPENAAALCYMWADAMLAERSK